MAETHGKAPETLAKPAENQLGISSHYILVIDAGSSGSRVHVYKYHWEAGNRFPTFVLPDPRLKTKPGLSSFAEHPADAGPSLKGLMDFAAEHVPVPMRADTPVILSATAGLRMVTTAQADSVLESCYAWLKANTAFRIDRKLISVISGQEEGAYGWLTINFLAQRLSGMAWAKNGTVGSIEVGGASTQVTVPVEAGSIGAEPGAFDLRLGDLHIPLYAHSYLGFGLEEARAAYNRKHAEQLTDPCFPVGYAKGPGGAGGAGYDVFHGRSHAPVAGSGDYEACRAAVAPLFDTSQACGAPPCSFNGVHQPAVARWPEMVAFENFFHAAHGVGAPHLDSPAGLSANDLSEAGRRFCAHTWGEIEGRKATRLYPNLEEGNKYRYCFALAYLPALLTHGLHLPPNHPLHVWGTVAGTAIEWSLGQALKAVEDRTAPSGGGAKPPLPPPPAAGGPAAAAAAGDGPSAYSTEQTIWFAGGMFGAFAVLFAISQIRANKARAAQYELVAAEASYEDASDLEAGVSPKVTALPSPRPGQAVASGAVASATAARGGGPRSATPTMRGERTRWSDDDV